MEEWNPLVALLLKTEQAPIFGINIHSLLAASKKHAQISYKVTVQALSNRPEHATRKQLRLDITRIWGILSRLQHDIGRYLGTSIRVGGSRSRIERASAWGGPKIRSVLKVVRRLYSFERGIHISSRKPQALNALNHRYAHIFSHTHRRICRVLQGLRLPKLNVRFWRSLQSGA